MTVRKGIALFLVIVLVTLLLPAQAFGVATTAGEIQQQIRNTYRRAFQLNNYNSFNGWCATLVNWQTYLLGIDTIKYGVNGNQEFDLYSKMTVTTGGYRVKSYPASRYTMRQAFDAITMGGTQDAYNVLVGFQWTHTAAGNIYGHACFIHAIIDGTVYFVESFNSGIGGKYWAEGTPISCSVEEFCRYYESWTRLDGVISFGLKNYADVCEIYSASMDAMTLVQTDVMFEPVDAGVNDENATVKAVLSKGEIVRVTELVKTPGGNYWYAVEGKGFRGYVPAGNLLAMEQNASDVTIENMKVPNVLRPGYGFVLDGEISTESNELKQVYLEVSSGEGAQKTVHFTADVKASGKWYSLNNSAVDNKMTFRKLPVGTYNLSISTTVTGHRYAGGELAATEETVQLWNSTFHVSNDRNTHYAITFDPAGGNSATERLSVAAGEAIGALPVPQRLGHTFVGWYTQKGEPVTEHTLATSNMKLIAHWIAEGTEYTGWVQTENGWGYMENGKPVSGWFTAAGVSFFRYEDGTVPTGWTEIEGKTYYFNALGAAQTGWIECGGNRYYMQDNGAAARGWTKIGDKDYWFADGGRIHVGWLHLDGVAYYLDADSACLKGEQEINGKRYSFREDGSLVTGWTQRDGKTAYLDDSGEMLTGWHNVDGVACYFGSDGGLCIFANEACNYGCLLNTGMGGM